MNKFLRLLFVLVIIAMLGASILQIFFHRTWEATPGTEYLLVGNEKLEYGI